NSLFSGGAYAIRTICSYTNDVARHSRDCQAATGGKNALCRIITHLPTVFVRKQGTRVCTAKCAPLARLYTNGTVRYLRATGFEMTQPTIRLNVNGKSHDVSAAGDTALLYVLRNDLALNGPKYGCGLGECGTCTVLIDGAAARSCVIPIEGCEG